MSRYLSSLRVRLTFLVLFSILPALIYAVHAGLRQRHRDGQKAEDATLRLAQLAANNYRHHVSAMRQLLVAMVQVPAVRGNDATACSQFLADEWKRYTFYVSFAVTDPHGKVVSSSQALTSTVSVADQQWFREALAARDFRVGNYQPSPIAGESAIHAACPILDRSGRVQGMLVATLGLQWLDQLTTDADLPEQATMTVYDDTGLVLARFPDRQPYVGQNQADTPLFKTVSQQRVGTAKQVGKDGQERLYGFVPLRATAGPPSAFAVVSIPSAIAYAQANKNLLYDIAAWTAVALLALAAIHLGGTALIVRPVTALVAATKRLASGDLQARTGEPYGRGEIEQLRRALDEMADSLARNERQLRQSNRALRTTTECNQALVRATDEPELLRELCVAIVQHGGYRLAWVGYPDTKHEMRRIQPVAQAGADDTWLRNWQARSSEGDTPPEGPAEAAFRSSKPVILQDVMTDPSFAPWRDDAKQRGYASVLALPLRSGSASCGVLTIHAAEAAAFSPDEVMLLNELADDLAYGIGVLRSRAEHREAERRLQESEQRFRSIVESSPMGMHFYEIQADGQLVFTGGNRAADLILGVDNRQFLGQPLETAFPALVGTEVPQRYRQVCTTGEAWRSELVRYEDKQIRGAFEVHAFQTGPNRMVALFAEISDRLRSQAALRESEQRFRELFAASPDAIFVESLNGIVLDVNPAACALHGMTHDQLVGRSVLELVPPEYREGVADDYLKLTSGEWNKAEGFSLHADGRRIPVEIKVGRTRYGAEPALLLHVRDITERVRAEELHRRLATAVEQAVEGILITDAQGTIQYVNPAVEAMTGYRREELIGQTPRIFKSGKHDDEFYRELWQTLTRGQVWRGFLFNRRKDGVIYQEEAMISAIRDPAGRVTSYVAAKRDVTREIALEIQLLQAQKMEAIGRLAGGLAHDFNNILTAITGYSELSLNRAPAGEPLRHHIEEILKAADRATTLTRQLLAFSRKQVLEPRVVDLNELVANVQRMLQRLIGEDVELVTGLDPSLWPIRADFGQIEQVIMNLAVNARDAMPLGGKLTIKTVNVTFTTPPPDRPNMPMGDYVELTVTDSGVGMSEDVKAHLFEPFFTTKPNDKGTGLGLATCYGIVEQSGGRIEVESLLGIGTTFRVFLPRYAEVAAPPVVVVPPESVPRSQRGETLLVVEDEAAVRELSTLVLSDLGYRVWSAGNGVEALQLLHDQKQPALDLLVTDVIMPQMGGRELAERLRQAKPDLRVLFCSGYTAEAEAVTQALTNRTQFLQKPFSGATLARKVREILDAP